MCLGKKMLILASSLIGASACSATYVAYTHPNIEEPEEDNKPLEKTEKAKESGSREIEPSEVFA